MKRKVDITKKRLCLFYGVTIQVMERNRLWLCGL